jgi:hypothetical protein
VCRATGIDRRLDGSTMSGARRRRLDARGVDDGATTRSSDAATRARERARRRARNERTISDAES